MARVKSPFLGIGASKQLGHSLIYKQKRSRSFVTRYNKPGGKNSAPASATQLNIRMLCNLIIARWLTITANERKIYDDLVKSKNLKMSGWNYFYREALKDLPTILGLQGYWSFNRIVGGKILDLSGNNNDGVLKPVYPSDCPILVDSINRRFGKAGYFDGTNDYVDCGSDKSLNITDKITIEAWINPRPNQEYCWDLIKGNYGVAGKVEAVDNSINWSWQLRYGSDDACHLGFQFNEVAAGSKWVTVKQDLVPGQWYHIVGTYDGTNIKCYLNGIEKDSNTLTGIVGYLNKLLICCEGWANHFNGIIDEFKIWDRALPQEEIQKHYKLRI